jgi:hypothetical protein
MTWPEVEVVLEQIEEDKQDDRNFLLAQKYEKPMEAYEEMSAAVDLVLDPSADISNLPQETQDWLRATSVDQS